MNWIVVIRLIIYSYIDKLFLEWVYVNRGGMKGVLVENMGFECEGFGFIN